VSDEGGIFEAVLLEESFDVVGKGGVGVDFVVWGVAVVACVDGVDWAGEGTGEGTVVRVLGLYCLWEVCDILADTAVVLLAAKQAVDDHDWVSFGAALIVMEAVCEIERLQARRRVKRTRPLWSRRYIQRLYSSDMLRMQKRRANRLYASRYRRHGD